MNYEEGMRESSIDYKPIIERYELDQERHKYTVMVQFGTMHADTEARESEGVGQHEHAQVRLIIIYIYIYEKQTNNE